MKESAGVLQQAKFICLVLKLILVSVIWETQTDENYMVDDKWFSILVLIFWVVGVIDFLLIFNGATIFNNQANLLQIFVHLFGITMLLDFKNNGDVSVRDEHFLACLVIAG